MIQADAVKYLLKGLSQMNREMFLAHYLLGERMASIGKRYGIGEAAVSLRMKESREFLQKRLRRGDKA
jgi:DNA-directed RNA polymerase specialized sigma24 family protein